MRHAADIAAWGDHHEAFGATAGLLDEHAAAYPDITSALRAAAIGAERHAGVPARALLSGVDHLDRRERLAVALADWAAEGDRDQLAANIALVDGLLAPGGRLVEFVRRQLLRPASSLTAATEPAPVGIAALRVEALHAIKTLARFGLALRRVRDGRPWRALPPAASDHEQTPAPAA